MHLPDAAIKASKGRLRASIGRAPNELIASTIRRLPARATPSAISASGFRMPVDVSQWTSATWVIDGSSRSRLSTAATGAGTSSAVSRTLTRRPIIPASFARRVP